MNKIINSLTDHLLNKINIRVKPEFSESFIEFLKTQNIHNASDGGIHNLPIVGSEDVECCPFILDCCEDLRDRIIVWDSEI